MNQKAKHPIYSTNGFYLITGKIYIKITCSKRKKKDILTFDKEIYLLINKEFQKQNPPIANPNLW